MIMPSKRANDNVGQIRQELSKKLQLYGYSACREALFILEDHYTSSLATNKYESIEDFLTILHRIITFDANDGTSVIGPDLAYLVVQKLCNNQRTRGNAESDMILVEEEVGEPNRQGETSFTGHAETIEQQPPTGDGLTVRVKNVDCAAQQQQVTTGGLVRQTALPSSAMSGDSSDFELHYKFLLKRLTAIPAFKQFELTTLGALTCSRQPSIRCICFGLLVRDISKIDGYFLIDSTGRVPVRITPDTNFRNRLAYLNCLVLVEGVYVNPDDVLFAANVGLPPILLDPIQDKSLACQDERMIIILKEIYMDEDYTCQAIEMLFDGYNAMVEPPLLFILVGDFTRQACRPSELRLYMKKLLRYIRACDNLKQSHFVFVPGQRDTCATIEGDLRENKSMPKAPLSRDQVPLDLMTLAGFNNIHLATNPAHIYIGDRLISVVSHSYLKELKKNLLHDLSDKNDELFETTKQIMLSNAHLTAGISKIYQHSMNLWHRPDLLVLADTEAFGSKYDYNVSRSQDTSFSILPSFSRQSNQFKVYYLKSGDIDDSEVSLERLREIELLNVDEDETCDEERQN